MNSIPLQAGRQRGGTLVGFIVGLLVGLAAALSVAIYVTRVPVPFIDRGVSRNPAEDALEAERNKNWNPNAALAGKDAASARPPAPAESPAAAEGGAIVVPPADGRALPPPPAPAAESRATAPAAPAAPAATAPARSSDPLGDLAQSRLGQTSPEAATADPFIYFVQAGAYRTPEDAESQRARLAMLGLSADVSERDQSGRTVYRVRLGPYAQKAQAEATRDQLAGRGVESAVVRVQR